MRQIAFLLIALVGNAALAQPLNPLQHRIDFDSVLSKELEALGDTSKLTEIQKADAWTAIEKKVAPYWQGKTWHITAQVEDIEDDGEGRYVVKFVQNVSQKADKCKWLLESSRIKMAYSKKEAASVHKGDFIVFTGTALHIPDDASEAKKLEFARKVNRGFAIPLHISYKKANIAVTITDTKYTRPTVK
jgi:hypothetical protein